MRSLIIGVTDNESNKNLELSEYTVELYQDFADYTRNLNEKEFNDSLNWFLNYLEHNFEEYIEIEGKTFKFKAGAVKNYFNNMKAKVLKLIEDAGENFKKVRYDLLNTIDYEFGIHIDFEEDVATFDNFMGRAIEGVTYYIYDILDYHI